MTVQPKIGDILHQQWGYDATFHDFYEVVRVTKTQVTVRKLHTKPNHEAGQRIRLEVLPDYHGRDETTLTRKFKIFSTMAGNLYYIKINDYSIAVNNYDPARSYVESFTH